MDFYPSITESLLDQSIDWATQFTAITDSDIRIIKHARKSLLFHDGLSWVKRDSSNAFDVTMGSYDGAEICELVGLFILSKLKDTFGNNIGLYRDDGLVLLHTKSGRLSDKARKDSQILPFGVIPKLSTLSGRSPRYFAIAHAH